MEIVLFGATCLVLGFILGYAMRSWASYQRHKRGMFALPRPTADDIETTRSWGFLERSDLILAAALGSTLGQATIQLVLIFLVVCIVVVSLLILVQ